MRWTRKKTTQLSSRDHQSALLKCKDEKLKKLESDYVEMKDKITYQENQSCRNNIRVDGIPESAGERWEDTERKLKQTLTGTTGFGDGVRF